MLFVGREGDGSLLGDARDDENQTYAIDGRWGIGDDTLVQAWVAQTDTPGRLGRDEAFSLSGEYNDADWTYSLGRRNAHARTAHFLLELGRRLAIVEDEPLTEAFPMTQQIEATVRSVPYRMHPGWPAD